MILALIIPLTLQFNKTTELNNIYAANFKNGIQLKCAARAGFHYGLAVLYEDGISTEYDSLNEDWAEPFRSDMDSSLKTEVFEVRINDLSARININKLIKEENLKKILELLLQSLEIESDDAIDDIINSLKDWIDHDSELSDEEGIGAENIYYQGLNKACLCRNGDFVNIEELSLIKGINNELYKELSKYLTVYGDDGININTAHPKILASLSDEMNDELADNMIEYRNNEKNDCSDKNWYKDVPGMSDISLNNITVSSAYFEIISSASAINMQKTIKTIIKREKKGEQINFHILSRKTD